MNTMSDLRRECAKRMRASIHGKEIDTLEKQVKTPHMLGIVPVGTDSNDTVEEGTILDHRHEFWTEFEDDIDTKNAVKKRVESAIRSLRKDDILRITYPYGEEAEIVYCEVDVMDEGMSPLLPTTCAGCGESIEVPIDLEYYLPEYSDKGSYTLSVDVDCPHCDFERVLESQLLRRTK